MAPFNILIIESNEWDRGQLRQHIGTLSHPVRVLGPADLESARHQPDIVVLGISDDVSLETSRATINRAREIAPHTQLILCAPRGLPDLDHRVLELKARAFVLKPVDENTLRRLLEETLSAIGLRSEREAYQRATRTSSRLAEVIGESEPIREVFALLEKVAESPTTSVLLLGESGVGKSLFAQMVHDMCEREHGPFIEINCSTLPQQLLESELFGYEPGAFTDARAQKIGLIELANGGTLFLDEITEVEPVTQAKLLKFLDTRRFRRLGGERELEVDVRVIAASNRDIRAEVRAGRFREDLYYRLNVVQVTIPPLRERPGDIDRIAAWYLDHFRKKFGKTSVEFSQEAWSLLRSHPWPGNVRELVNAIERAVLMCPDDAIDPEHFPIEPARDTPQHAALRESGGELQLELPEGGARLDAIERAAIEETLRRTRGNISQAARMLGLSRGALRNKLTRYRIDTHHFARRVLVES